MVTYLRFVITMLLAVLLVGLSTGESWAGVAFTVQIDDLTDTVSVAVLGGISPTILPGSTGEFLHFTLPGTDLLSVPQAANLFEDFVGGTLSDRLLVTPVAGANFTDVKFASDPATLTLPPGVLTVSLVENGTFQNLFSTPATGGGFNFQVRSDVVEQGDVPAPATLLLVGSGLAGLAGVAARPRRR